jgi:TonB-dependent receptor
MRFFGLIALFLTISFNSFAQKAKIEGKITDTKSGLNLSGVSISVDGEKAKTSSNTDGYFQLSLEAGKKYTIKLSSVGFTSKEIADVEAKANEVTHLDVTLEIASKTETGVVIRSSAKKESVAALIAYQKNAPVLAQVISAEAIRRSPDKNTGEVLKRVPGLSIQDGKYLVVRGLADRYNQAMLNGVLMGSTEPDRKAFSFDIFPSSIIDNIIINKAFVPEMSGEWAGGLIQVNTNDVPSKNFADISIGTGFNSQTIGKDFYKYEGGSSDFLGFDDGKRALPAGFPMKSDFNNLTQAQKTVYAKQFENIWATTKSANNNVSLMSRTFKFSSGFTRNLGVRNKLAGIFAVNYNLTPKITEFENRIFSISDNIASTNFDYNNTKYSQDVLVGVLANITLQLGSNNKISFKNILNVNTTNYATIRTGKDYESNSSIGDNIRASELAFKANTFVNTQITGDHSLVNAKAKIHWFGSFQILDQYIPDQRRIQFNQDNPSDLSSPYSMLVSASKSSQRSGSRYYGFLNDYNYTAGGDISKQRIINQQVQTMKVGYFFQVKDRLFDSRPFSIYMPIDNPTLKHLNESNIFNPENFGNGIDNKFAFNEIYDARYRYMANSILNAGFIQFDNQLLNNKLRAVWGVRVEDYDQLIGSVKQSDSRHVHIQKRDYLPGVNLSFKLDTKSNLRLSGSQTVVRPEFRELSSFSFFDFDLGATVTGNPSLERTKVNNADLRYEIYPRAGELFTVGAFYKYFKSPTELYFNNTGAGSSGTFNYISPDHAYSYGAEMDFRKKLDFSSALQNFTLHGNLAYIYNRVAELNRPMQGQSPYLINLGLQYDIEKSGFSTTLLFNQIGKRIYYVGGSDVPPVWEAPRPLLDLQIAKKVLKTKGEIKLNIADLFNQQAKFYHDLNDNGKYDANVDALAISRKYGTNVSISFGYKL